MLERLQLPPAKEKKYTDNRQYLFVEGKYKSFLFFPIQTVESYIDSAPFFTMGGRYCSLV